MQVFIAKLLNRLLLAVILVITGLGAGLYFVSSHYHDYFYPCLAAYFILAMFLTLGFKWLENSWDKRVITKMARAGKIALANIESAKRFLPLRDTGFTRYWIFEFAGTLYDSEHNPVKKTFYEKMNISLENIPQGSVYVTWDPVKPAQIFIIPNALVGALPNLMPIVNSYEKDTNIRIKYLDAHYNKGMVVRSFQEAVKEYKAGAAGGEK
jgi:hypothetical protein